MPNNELFLNPTVKQVIFQIRFPNLFYVESKIGDFQFEIMDDFPESQLLIQQPISISTSGSKIKFEENDEDNEGIRKIFQFSSPKKYNLSVQSDSLSVTSEFHKTYDNQASNDKFQSVIEKVLQKFYKIMKIPVVTRLGLRYINECPLPQKETGVFTSYYNSAIDFHRFPIESLSEMNFISVISKGTNFLRRIEALHTNDNKYSLVLDLDGFARMVKPEDSLSTANNLHEIIVEEFFATIKEPVKDFMRIPVA
jgi:uncharacterized protein (TIGR04255 family)